jgi:hypothetical protein
MISQTAALGTLCRGLLDGASLFLRPASPGRQPWSAAAW